MPEADPLQYKAEADALRELPPERAAEPLRELLREASRQLDPFPPFPGAFFSYGMEVEIPNAGSPERGCIVLAPDGELYELAIGQETPVFAEDLADPVAMRKEELKPLEDLHPRDYVLYAHAALVRVVELLLERRAEKRP